MPVIRGPITFARFRVEQVDERPADVKRWLSRGFRAHAFEPLDPAGEDDVSSGWVEIEDADQTELAPSRLIHGEYVLVAYRVDRLRVPAAQVRAELDKWTRAFEANNKRPPRRAERAEEREAIVARLRKRAFPVSKTHDVSWNLSTDQLQIWSTSRKVVDEIEAALEKQFHLRLHALAPGAYSSLLRLPAEAEALLAPTSELMPDVAAVVGG